MAARDWQKPLNAGKEPPGVLMTKVTCRVIIVIIEDLKNHRRPERHQLLRTRWWTFPAQDAGPVYPGNMPFCASIAVDSRSREAQRANTEG
jgi:hypothetical protein